MRRVITVDGYYEGPNQEFDWPNVDDEFLDFSIEQLDEIGTLVFGRVTYEGMADYWPTPEAKRDIPEIAARMNCLDKLVVSRTLETANWENARLVQSNAAGELSSLKQQTGKDIAIFGSSNLTVNLLHAGLVDELRIMVNPVALGAGHSIFKTSDRRIPLTLLATRVFNPGNVLLSYQPEAPTL